MTSEGSGVLCKALLSRSTECYFWTLYENVFYKAFTLHST